MKTKITDISVSERGTVPAMKWIANNHCPELQNAVVSCGDKPYLIVSSQPEEELWPILEEHPVSTWHDIDGMKRIAWPLNDYPCWYFYINGHYYFASVW